MKAAGRLVDQPADAGRGADPSGGALAGQRRRWASAPAARRGSSRPRDQALEMSTPMLSSVILSVSLACHAGLSPAYPFGTREKTGAILLRHGPSRPARDDPPPPLRGVGLSAAPASHRSPRLAITTSARARRPKGATHSRRAPSGRDRAPRTRLIRDPADCFAPLEESAPRTALAGAPVAPRAVRSPERQRGGRGGAAWADGANPAAPAWAGALQTRLPGAGRRGRICRRTNPASECGRREHWAEAIRRSSYHASALRGRTRPDQSLA